MNSLHNHLWHSCSIARATGGVNERPFSVSGVAIDSRTLKQGDLFVALKGPNFDGHDYIDDAVYKGAYGFMGEAEKDYPLPAVKVANTMEGLWDLAGEAVFRHRGKRIGITGSVGKTGTKNMLARALSALGKVHATEGNLNNHIGVPLTLARMDAHVSYGVIEMGMNAPKEITPLSNLSRLHVAMVTNVHGVHLENFDSVTGIAHAKAEIFSGLSESGVGIIPHDSPYYDVLKEHTKNHLSFGRNKNADVVLDSYNHGNITCETPLGVFQFYLPLKGEHWAENAMGVIATLIALDEEKASIEKALLALEEVEDTVGRGNQLVVKLSDKETFTIVDETYNASPPSVIAALSLLKQTNGKRKVAVLGDMVELGHQSNDLHLSIKEHLMGIDAVYLVGKHMEVLSDQKNVVQWMAHEHELPIIDAYPGDVVIAKASRSMNLDRWVKRMEAHYAL